MVESTWSGVVGWILLHQHQMTVQFLDDLGVPILMGLGRAVNSGADLAWKGKMYSVSRMCLGRVSGRPVRTLTFPLSLLMGEGSRRGLVLVALGVRLVVASWALVGSGVLVGMVGRLVWRLLLSGIVGRLMRSCLQRPVSGAGMCQKTTWRSLTMTGSGLILDCWGLCSWVMVGQRRRYVLILWMVVRRWEGSVLKAKRSECPLRGVIQV
jgi:hypothetical protein